MKNEEIIALVKELCETEDLTTRTKDVAFIKRVANRINKSDEDNFSDRMFSDEFNKYYSELAKKESTLIETIVKEKTKLANKAKELVNAKDFKKATEELTVIFNEFKALGYTTKAQDDALWSELKANRDAFYKAKQAHYENVRETIEKNKLGKEELVKKVKELNALENIQEAGKQITSLMDEWKKLGFAGKEVDDALWNEFNTARQEIYAKRKAYYEKMDEVYAERANKKAELIKKARVYLANSNFTDEEIAALKGLREEWKAVGFAGKAKDDALYEEFNGVVNKYFSEMRFYKHQD